MSDGPGATGAAPPRWLPPAEPAEHARACALAFTERTGALPDGVWAAPGRVNLVGEHVDYNGGPVLPVALEHRTVVAARRRRDRVLRLWSSRGREPWTGQLDELRAGSVTGWAAYPAGVAWALQEAARGLGASPELPGDELPGADVPGLDLPGADLPGLDVVVDGRVPVGSGLSSSAALTCSVALAIADLAGLPGVDPDDDAGRRALAAACVRAENEMAGAPTGGMDQAVALRARKGTALLLDCATADAEHVPLDLERHGLAVLVVDTRAHHALVDGQYGDRRAACERAAGLLGVERLAEVRPADLDAVLRRLAPPAGSTGTARAGTAGRGDELVRCVRHVVSEVGRVRRVAERLRAGEPELIGDDLTASHASLRDDYRVSAPELDLAVDSALAAGALGARMTGGGFGGSALALCRTEALDEVAAVVAAAFARSGLTPPAFLPCRPAGPAERVG